MTVVDLVASIVAILVGVLFIAYVSREALRGAPDRRAEDEARAFFDRHGRWPDD
jgi:hypothetical protein